MAVRADVVHVADKGDMPSQPSQIDPVGLIREIADMGDVEAAPNDARSSRRSLCGSAQPRPNRPVGCGRVGKIAYHFVRCDRFDRRSGGVLLQGVHGKRVARAYHCAAQGTRREMTVRPVPVDSHGATVFRPFVQVKP